MRSQSPKAAARVARASATPSVWVGGIWRCSMKSSNCARNCEPDAESLSELRHPGHRHRSLPEIRTLIDGSALSAAGKARAVAMFQRTEAPILGMIENMAFFTNPATGEAIEIFGRGGARAEAGQPRFDSFGSRRV